MKTTGIFGGTFDPVHFGHLRPALEVADALGLDQIRLIPCGHPPHRTTPAATAEQRCAMLELAIADQSRFILDRRELDTAGPSYTVNTLATLRQEFPQDALCLILGSDAWNGLSDWHRPQQIARLAHIVVAHRPGSALTGTEQRLADLGLVRATSTSELAEHQAGRVWFQSVTALDISATKIRLGVGLQQDMRYLLPDTVLAYIIEQKLYRRMENKT